MQAGITFASCTCLTMLLLAGCQPPGSNERFRQQQRDLAAAAERIDALEDKLAAQQQTIRSLSAQLNNVRDIPGDIRDLLVLPERITLASLSGGYDEDDTPGDDGIVLYIQPIDRDGDVVKAVGTLKVTLMEPLNPPGQVEYAVYYFDQQKMREFWHGQLMTNHFTVRCPWPEGRLPAHDEITVHAVFTELVTGEAMSVSETFEITQPVEPSPATAPAATP